MFLFFIIRSLHLLTQTVITETDLVEKLRMFFYTIALITFGSGYVPEKLLSANTKITILALIY